MKNLVIDIGNSRIKSALFEEDRLDTMHVFDDMEEAVEFWRSLNFQRCLVSSVASKEFDLRAKLPFDFVFLCADTPTPLINGYATPATLGLDRMAAAVGAWHLAKQTAALAIDLGTCITYDLVDGEGVYRGGAISPGLKMRAKAMHAFTSSLPEISLTTPPSTHLGDATEACLQVGVWSGVGFEMEGFIAAYRVNFPEISVYLCGGDAESFDSFAKDHIFVVQNLVLLGLNCILNHHVA
jgi:type III pantothenate kinase